MNVARDEITDISMLILIYLRYYERGGFIIGSRRCISFYLILKALFIGIIHAHLELTGLFK